MKPEDYAKWQPKYSQYEKTYGMAMPVAAHLMTSRHHMQQAAIIGLAAEAGELLGVLQKANRKGIPISPEKALDEASDVRWYYQMFLKAFDLTDDKVTDYNKTKLDKRNAVAEGTFCKS